MAYNSSPLNTSPTSTQGPKAGGDLINANFTEIPNMLALKEDKVKRTITTTNPTVNNDSSQGYAVWSLWANTTTGEFYRCVNATIGAAVWVIVGGSPTGYQWVAPTSSATYTYTDGLLTGATDVIDGLNRVATYSYTAGVLTSAAIVYDGVTRTETYTYTNGVLTGISVTEV